MLDQQHGDAERFSYGLYVEQLENRPVRFALDALTKFFKRMRKS